jgi:Flp pilus assembly protein TadG
MHRLLKRFRSQWGASAVEFALVVPLLLMLLLGIVEFGRVFNAQLQITAAARESVRVMAISKQADTAISAAKQAAPHLNPMLATSNITIAANSCTAVPNATVTISYSVSMLSGLFAEAVPLTAKAVMRCGG